MREIKFRQYHKELKYMSEVLEIDFSTKDILDENGISSDFKEIELMQYINCKDHRGNLIFEGDILLSSNEHGTFLQLIGFEESERDEDSILFGFKIINGYTLEDDDLYIDECKSLTKELIKKHDILLIKNEDGTVIMDGWWVIGNKYENPELIELIENKKQEN